VITQEIEEKEDAPLPAESTVEDALALARVATIEDAEATQAATNLEEIAAIEEAEVPLHHALVINAAEEATHRERV